jgi:hypothetical protein
MTGSFRAVDVRAACGKFFAPGASHRPIRRLVSLAQLPATERLVPRAGASNQAILSWRWDVNSQNGTSRNITVAVAHASGIGVDYLFVDAVSVDQRLTGFSLVRDVADFTALFGYVPAIAAYDSPNLADDSRHFLRALRRPWIAREIRAMRLNPHKLQYVGHIPGQGTESDFGFAHMAERIWQTSFANSILYVLTGYCDMHDVSELALIMPEHSTLLSAAAEQLPRNDALVTAALLSQLSTNDPRINEDIDLKNAAFSRYLLEQIDGSAGFWENWHILLDGKPVGTWSEKNYTRDGAARRKLSVAGDVREVLAASLGVALPDFKMAHQHEISSDELEKRLADLEVVDLSDRLAV